MTTSGILSAVGQTLVAPLNGGKTVATFYLAGTFTGANLIFEQSPDSTDGVDGTWFPASAGSINANTVSTTTGVIASGNYGYDLSATGASFARVRVTALSTGSIAAIATVSASSVDPTPNQQTQAVTQSGTFAVTQSGAWTVSGSGTFTISGAVTQSGAWTVAATQSGAWNVGQTGTWNVNSTPKSATTGGLTRLRVISAATTNATVVKASAGQLYTVHAFNTSAATKFIKFYNKATAPTVGTDTPVETYAVPAGQNLRVSFDGLGAPFATGIGLAITGAAADTDATAVAGGDVLLNVHYA